MRTILAFALLIASTSLAARRTRRRRDIANRHGERGPIVARENDVAGGKTRRGRAWFSGARLRHRRHHRGGAAYRQQECLELHTTRLSTCVARRAGRVRRF